MKFLYLLLFSILFHAQASDDICTTQPLSMISKALPSIKDILRNRKASIITTSLENTPYKIYSLPYGLKGIWRSAENYDINTEMATYIVSEAFGFHLVPPTVTRSFDGQRGVFQLMVKPTSETDLESLDKESRAFRWFFEFVIGRTNSYLDTLLNNTLGKKPFHNYFYSEKGNLVSVENDRSFDVDFWPWQSVYHGIAQYQDNVLPREIISQENDSTEITSRIALKKSRQTTLEIKGSKPIHASSIQYGGQELLRFIDVLIVEEKTMATFRHFLITNHGRRIMDAIKSITEDRVALASFKRRIRRYLSEDRFNALMGRTHLLIHHYNKVYRS